MRRYIVEVSNDFSDIPRIESWEVGALGNMKRYVCTADNIGPFNERIHQDLYDDVRASREMEQRETAGLPVVKREERVVESSHLWAHLLLGIVGGFILAVIVISVIR